MEPAQMAYDRAITVFSPDGRLFQVEYARKAVERGTTTLGIKFKDGVLLMTDKRMRSRLVEIHTIQKIFVIDEHIGCATSGLVADARTLVDYARIIAQIERVTYNEKIPVEALVKRICDYKQQFTQYGGVRPFGVSLLIAGIDDQGIHLYETDPSGAMVGYKADCIGVNRDMVMEMLEKEYSEDMSMEDAIKLGLKALKESSEEEFREDTVEIGYIKVGEEFRVMSDEEVKKILEKIE